MNHELKVPTVGESVREVQIGQWLKQEGDWADKDEPLVEIESDKATVDIAAPVAGTLDKILHRQGDIVPVGEIVGHFSEGAKPDEGHGKGTGYPLGAVAATSPTNTTSNVATEPVPLPIPTLPAEPAAKPAGNRIMPSAAAALAQHGVRAEAVAPTGPGGRMLKEDVLRHVEKQRGDGKAAGAQAPAERSEAPAESSPPAAPSETVEAGQRPERIVPMTWLRRQIAERLVEAQNTAALVTTFNEIDMSAVIALRQQYREAFQQRYQVKLGFMSFFVKAVVEALKSNPALNAEIRQHDIVYRDYFDIGVAVGGGKGLVVPVLRDAQRLGFAETEQMITDFAARAQSGKLKPEELIGGTFTISNGGVFGSLLSTPIVNPPQSGILGLHAITERPVARDGQVVIRPMMYVALTYDHRIVDGREAVVFLRRVKEIIEDPTRILLEI